MAILNYTTTIEPAKTVTEIQALFARHGVRRVMIEYAEGVPSGLAVEMDTAFGARGFRLPARVDGVLAALKRQVGKGRVTKSMVNRAHAARVAWRILKDRVEVDLAYVESGLVTIDEVFLPYMIARDDRTVYELIKEQHLALPAPRKGDT